MREDAGRLDFNLILLPSPMADKNQVPQLSSVALFILGKMQLHMLFWSLQTFYEC